MSTDTPTTTVTDQNPAVSAAVGGKQQPKKKTNKQREQARSMFNASAPSLSAEKYFSEWVEKKRQNVEIVFDTGVLERIAEPYVTKAKNHATNKYHRQESNLNLQASTFALTGMALCRKMLLSVPDSEEYELGRFREIRRTEFMAPKSVIAAVANVGKFELDDKVCRLKYNSQDVFRMLITICKVMNQHSDYADVYNTPVQDTLWEDLDVTKLVITSEASVRWLRDEAVKFLERAYENTWQVDYHPPPTEEEPEPPVVQMTCTYPRLKIVADADQQLENVVAWIARLNARMPGVQFVIAAGFATAWKLLFFQRVGHLFSRLVRGLPDWITTRPFDVLTTLGLHHCDIATDDYDGVSYVGFINAIHQHLVMNVAFFAEFLELGKQPDDKFGTAAQLIPYNRNDFVERGIIGMEDFSVQRLRADAQTVCITKLKDRGLATAGLIFGFAQEVTVVPNYIGRVNGDPNSVRNQFFKSDLKSYQ